MHNVIINANTSIGYNCIINNKVLIEHDVKGEITAIYLHQQ